MRLRWKGEEGKERQNWSGETTEVGRNGAISASTFQRESKGTCCQVVANGGESVCYSVCQDSYGIVRLCCSFRACKHRQLHRTVLTRVCVLT